MAKKDIKAFSFYRSYFEALKDIPKEDAKEVLYAINEYIFENKTPKFKGIMKTIWTLIEPNLTKSKNKSNLKSGAPIGNQNARKSLENKEENNTIKKQSKNNQNSTNDIMTKSYSYINNLLSYIIINNQNNSNRINKLFIEYIKVRINKNYDISEVIVERLIELLNEYAKTDKEKIDLLGKAINGSWKDFYPLKEEKGDNNGTEYCRI